MNFSVFEFRQRQEILIFAIKPDLSWGPIRTPMKWILGSFLGLRRSERELEDLLPSSAEFKNECKYICNSLLYSHDLLTDKYNSYDFGSADSYRPI